MSKTILIIEDDHETRFLFSTLLEEEGHAVTSKGNGVDALEYLEKNSVDLIFMDLNFPLGTPEEFMEKLRLNPNGKEVPVILVSGRADIQDYAIRLNAYTFVKKPFEIDPLLDLIQTI